MWWLWGTSSILLQPPSAIRCQVTGSWPPRCGHVMLILVFVVVAAAPWSMKVAVPEVQGQEKMLVEHGEPLRCSACLGGSLRSRSKQVDLHRRPRWINPQEELVILVHAGLRTAGWGGGMLLRSRASVVASSELPCPAHEA